MAYKETNIEDMLESINNNNRAIMELVEENHCNSKIIDNTMSAYVKSSKRLNPTQMNIYKDYAGELQNFKKNFHIPPQAEIYTEFYKSQDLDMIADKLKEVHTKQVSIMDVLCDLLEKSRATLATLQ